MLIIFSLISTLWAGPVEDLALASSKAATETQRMAAFERIVALGSTDMALVSKISQDDGADSRQRWVAVRALGQIKGDRAKNILIGLVADPMPAIRAASASAMGDYGDPDCVPYLVRLIQDPAVIVRAAAASALTSSGDERAVDILSEALSDKKNTFRGRSIWVRKYFVDALGGTGSTSAYPALLRAMDDSDPDVVGRVIPALEKIAGFSYSEGRSPKKEVEAWRRFISNELRR
jgi:HEAT repeat protein